MEANAGPPWMLAVNLTANSCDSHWNAALPRLMSVGAPSDSRSCSYCSTKNRLVEASSRYSSSGRRCLDPVEISWSFDGVFAKSKLKVSERWRRCECVSAYLMYTRRLACWCPIKTQPTIEGKRFNHGYVNSYESSIEEGKTNVGDPRPVLIDCWALMRGTVGVTS